MKKIITSALMALFLTVSLCSVGLADESVRGYTRKDGTYVAPHFRSSPDSNPYNNYSFPGNTNPYTGKVAPGNSDTYLQRYNNNPNTNQFNSNPFQNPYWSDRK